MSGLKCTNGAWCTLTLISRPHILADAFFKWSEWSSLTLMAQILMFAVRINMLQWSLMWAKPWTVLISPLQKIFHSISLQPDEYFLCFNRWSRNISWCDLENAPIAVSCESILDWIWDERDSVRLFLFIYFFWVNLWDVQVFV